jgi:CheY-like chemotaxis protein/curved DNA-binding protein CbpA
MGKDKDSKLEDRRDAANACYRRLERVVKLIENSKTLYDALGLRPGASRSEILRAHQRAISVLNPLYHKTMAILSPEAQRRIDKAAKRVAVACSILSNDARRIEYDKFIGVGGHEGQSTANNRKDDSREADLVTLKQTDQRSLERQSQRPIRCGKTDQAEASSRRSERLKLALPVRVSGHRRTTGEWSEMTETVDVSRNGCKITLSRRVGHCTVVHLSLPLPLELRGHRGPDPNYNVYAVVRRVDAPKDGRRIVALEFIGEKPPQGFSEKPWAAFRTKWTGAERRRQPRVEKSELVAVEFMDEAMRTMGHDDAVTENISPGGMRIRLGSPAPDFELIKVIRAGDKRETLAVVRDHYRGDDGLERICLRFIGNMPASALAAEPCVKPPRAKGKKILIADDDAPLRRVLGKILTDAGYEVLLAEDGQSAVEKAATERPHLVIADGLMPRMHGFLACKAIKQMQSPPKVIVLTAVYRKKNYRWEAREQYDADELLTKPFELSQLLACIEEQLADPASGKSC